MKFLLMMTIAAFAGSSQAPFRSDEKMMFESIAKNPVSMIGRHVSFAGLLHFPEASTEDLRELGLYEFQKLSEPLSVVNCTRLTNEILFIKPEFPIRVARAEVFEGRFGKACEVTVLDADPSAHERRVYLSQIRSNLYAIVATFPKGNVPHDVASELRKSILSLR